MHKPCDILVLQFGKKQTPRRTLELLGSPMGHAIKKAPPGSCILCLCHHEKHSHPNDVCASDCTNCESTSPKVASLISSPFLATMRHHWLGSQFGIAVYG